MAAGFQSYNKHCYQSLLLPEGDKGLVQRLSIHRKAQAIIQC